MPNCVLLQWHSVLIIVLDNSTFSKEPLHITPVSESTCMIIVSVLHYRSGKSRPDLDLHFFTGLLNVLYLFFGTKL